jgi:hypothetical protein
MDTVNGLFTSKGLEAPIQPSSQAVLRYTAGEKTAGQQVIDAFIRRSLKGFLGKSIAATIGGGVGAKVGEPMMGAMVGEHLLGPVFQAILPGISKPLLENPTSIEALKSGMDYAAAVARGDKALNQAVKGVFSGSGKAITSHVLASNDRDRLDRIISENTNAPTNLMDKQGTTPLAHYMPGHQIALTQATMQTIKYLEGLKPHDQKLSPLDKPVPPSQAQITRYNRALAIAQNPILILDKARNGSIQAQDLQDLNSMYPNYYQQIVKKLSAEMTSKESNGETIPYRTRMGISLLMGQPVDSTMQPMSIMAAQGSMMQPANPNQNQPMKSKKVSQQAGKGLEKGAAKYQTQDQAAESDRTSRE